MTKARSLAYLVGVVATAGGFAIVAGVSLGLELTDLFLTLVAVLATIQGLRYVQRRRDTPTRTTTTGDPELRVEVPVPGADFDDELVAAMTRRSRWDTRERLVSRLEQRARRALVLRDGRTPAKADELIDTGAWTDDVVAARFLGASVSVPLQYRLRLLLSGQSVLVARVERTIAAIEHVGTTPANIGPDSTNTESGPTNTELDSANVGDGELDSTNVGDGEPDSTNVGDGEPDSKNAGDGEPDHSAKTDGERR